MVAAILVLPLALLRVVSPRTMDPCSLVLRGIQNEKKRGRMGALRGMDSGRQC